jgi:AcrR family transcriptional regulator
MRAEKTDTEIRQEQIAGAALDLIGTEGIHALSIAGIAQRVGIVPSAVYKHYKGKDDVLEAVLNMLQGRLIANVEASRKETRDALGRLKAILMLHVRMLAENRAIPHMIFSDGMYTGHPERKARVHDIMTRYLGEIQKIVQEGQREGTIRSDAVPQTVSVMFLGMILPAAVLWSVSGGRFDVVMHAENAWPAFERGIAEEA